jgi:hypothetical protein
MTDPKLLDEQLKQPEEYTPKTPLGEKLVSIRNEYIRKGGKLLNEEEFDEELKREIGENF